MASKGMQGHGNVQSRRERRCSSCLWQGDCKTKASSWGELLCVCKLCLEAALPAMAAEYVPEPQLGSIRRQAFLMPFNTSSSGSCLLSTCKGECSHLNACRSIQGYLIRVLSSCLLQDSTKGLTTSHSKP